MAIREFLHQTRRATIAFFDGIQAYKALIWNPEVVPPVVWGPDFDRQMAEWFEENKEAVNRDLVQQRTYVEEYFALATLCGAVLHLAHHAIARFSDNIESSAPAICQRITNSRIKKYCIGRIVRGVPLGLVVYTGRNQHAHIGEDLRSPNLEILEQLVEGSGEGGGSPWIHGSEFEYSSGNPESMAPDILELLQWESVKDYERDMIALFE